MVRGMVLLSLGPGELCRLIYSRSWAAERQPGPAGRESPAEAELRHQQQRLRSKEQLAAVARQVKSSCILSRQAAEKPVPDFGSVITEELAGSQDLDLGVFRLPAGDIYAEETTVVWAAVLSLGFALICDPHENLMLAENTLKMIVKYFMQHLNLLVQGNDVVLKTDRIEAILNTFLPHGQLMFLNCCFIQSLEKELNASIFK
ncbi:AP-5 complex subunit sigma-1 [Chiloscyllium plagiosum]|uniref:AP-5 complex subunit sigma-1 n=1 Tax=Chiloscyllium plagiosum TaxID=36176 RepID=UPI001CB83CF9|nr:AP-5 complex subunit sigma-1 [Chiloscyllium plagiosum]